MGSLRSMFMGFTMLCAASSQAVAQEEEMSANQAVFDKAVSDNISKCSSGAQNLNRVYYVLVDKSASIDDVEWALMMKGLKRSLTHEAILGQFNHHKGVEKPRYLIAHIQFGNKAHFVQAACIETAEDMKKFAVANFTGEREKNSPYLGAYTHIHEAFMMTSMLHESFERLGWKAQKDKVLLVADGREQGSEEELRLALKAVRGECIEIDTVAIVPGDVGGDDTQEELIEYLKTVHTPSGSACNVRFKTSDGRTLEFPEPMVAGTTYPAWGFENTAPAVLKALGFGGT